MKPQLFDEILVQSAIRVFCALSIMASPAVFAAPSEQSVQILTRTAATGQILETTLTKNQFRQESYQEDYEVQVPYQATETYVESVPYETQEAYTEYEQSCSTEYRCHDVDDQQCGYENQCRTVSGGQDCRQERVCRPTPGQQRCEEVEECGTNAQGERICKTRKVCHQEAGGEDCDYVQRCENRPDRQECSNEYRCHNTSRPVCGNEQVCSSQPVTKYRTVTKYREETRTREVTKYRTETRCCVTKYHDVFDHQDSLKVIVRFPQGSGLLVNEAEKFKVTFEGDAAHPDVTLSVVDSVLGYKVASKSIQGAVATIDLALAPKFSADQVSEKSISGLKLMIKPQGVAIALTDSVGAKARLVSTYAAVIKNKVTGAIVAQVQSAGIQSTNVVIPVPEDLSADLDYSVDLTVQRSGLVLASPVSFIVKAEYLFERIDASQLGVQTIRGLKLVDAGANLSLSFADKGASAKYETNYQITLIGEKDGKVIFQKQVNSEEILKPDQSAVLVIPGQELSDSQDYKLTLAVERVGNLLSAAVSFEAEARYGRVIDGGPYSNSALVGNLDIQGAELNATLILKDAAPTHSAVTKTYKIFLERTSGFLGSKREAFLEKTLTASQVKLDAGGIAKLKLRDLGVDPETLSKYVRDGKTVFVSVTFVRQSPRLNGGKAIQILKETKLKIQE